MTLLRWQQNIVDEEGDVLPSATVEIRDEVSGSLVNLFEDIDGVTPKGNPLTTDSDGYGFAYMEPGRFKITATSADQSFTKSWRDVRLANDFSELDSRINQRVIYVDSVSELEARTPIVGQAAEITASGRAGLFVFRSGDQSANVTNDPEQGVWIAPSSDATGASGAWMRRYDGLTGGAGVNSSWFGVLADGSTDDTTALLAAIDYLTLGTVWLPDGVILTTGITLDKSGVSITGSGERATDLRVTSATADTITVGTSMSNVNDSIISNLTFSSSVTKTGGSYVVFENGHNLKIENIRMESPYTGVTFLGGDQQFLYYIENFEINNPVHNGFVVGGPGSFVQDLWVSDGIIAGAGEEGILFLNCSGLYFDAVDVLTCRVGLSFFPPTGELCKAGFFNQVIADTCVEDGWAFLDNGGNTTDMTLTACWGASSGTGGTGHGFKLLQGSGKVDNILFSGCLATNNAENGIALLGCKNVTISNTSSTFNSTNGSGLKHGLEVAANVSDWTVTGGIFGSGGAFSGNNQGYGIFVNSGTSDFYSIIGADCTGNVNGGVSDGGSGGDKYIYGNQGYRTSNSGEATAPSGVSSLDVNHGLAATPARTDVQLTPIVDPNGAGINRFWVSAADSVKFTITFDASTTSDMFFGWSARVKGA